MRWLVVVGKDGAGLVHDVQRNYQPVKMFSDEQSVEQPIANFFRHGEETLLTVLADGGATVLVYTCGPFTLRNRVSLD